MDTVSGSATRQVPSGMRFPHRSALVAWLRGTNAGQEVMREVVDHHAWLWGTAEGELARRQVLEQTVELPRILIEVCFPTATVRGAVTVYSDDVPASRVKVVSRPGVEKREDDDRVREIVGMDLPGGWRTIYENAKAITMFPLMPETATEWCERQLRVMWTADVAGALRDFEKENK